MRNSLIIITILLSANMSMGFYERTQGAGPNIYAKVASHMFFHDYKPGIVQIRGCSTQSLVENNNESNPARKYGCPKQVTLKLATQKYVDNHYYRNQNEINTTETRITNKLSVYLSEIVELKVQEKNDEEAAIAAKNALNREDVREMIRRIVREEIREVGR